MAKTTWALIFDGIMIILGFTFVLIFFIKGFDIYLMMIPFSVIFSSSISLYMDLKKRKSDTERSN
ncbi:hypothetical protein [Staphylococcus intermedius]|uniref:hypothetical protein n=1 Tax=Staphylococcus intermedius TaxID=1285 RepID=UPI000BBCCAAC|nr:hypothetical protein [Staphylococcus intermedius]PCF86341.1 hypothetical protein B4W76_08860 [Staphylococcus intermedius]